MEALLAFVRESSLPKTVRANVASEPVCSVTVGAVDKRSDGYGISAATLLHRGYFMRLLHDVVQDAGLRGSAPPFYTSVCLNVGFAARFHVDSRNEGRSFIVSGGDYTGGELFCEGPGDDVWHAEEELNVQGRAIRPGAAVTGTDYDIRRSWFQFDGSILHAVRPFAGERVSIVYFCVPRQKITAALSSKLRALGFPLPERPLCALRWPSPYHIYICSTRRSGTLGDHTLSTLFRDGSVATGDVTLCLRDARDVDAYAHFGLNIIVDEVAAQETPTYGLPEQRRLCVVGRPLGSWNLFVDDDALSIHTPEGMSLHDLVLLGFLMAEQEGVRLWGLNTSADSRNVRDNISRRVGLVCGYFFGVVHSAQSPPLTLSDGVQGAAEDVERSLRFFCHSGVLRLNFAAVVAKTWVNLGGLQEALGDARASAHEYVVRALAREFSEHLAYDASRPNRCRFLASCGAPVKSDGYDAARVVEAGPAQEQPPKAAKPQQASNQCAHCGKLYRRRADLLHHVRLQHEGGAPRHACPNCGRLFLKDKDMKAHVRGLRCGSKRGRYKPSVPESAGTDVST